MRTITAIAIAALFLTACGSSEPKEKPFTVESGTGGTNPGEAVYNQYCISCHQASGNGVAGVYPPLAKSDFLADKEKAIAIVLNGQSGEIAVNGQKYNSTMPPQPLNDEDAAAVLTYVYNSFGNAGGTVTPAEVKAVRDRTK